jgi:hypothetical protein
MFYIATSAGFVEAIRNLNHRWQIDTIHDIRKAQAFTTFAEAEKEARHAALALPRRAEYYAVVSA